MSAFIFVKIMVTLHGDAVQTFQISLCLQVRYAYKTTKWSTVISVKYILFAIDTQYFIVIQVLMVILHEENTNVSKNTLFVSIKTLASFRSAN